MSADDTNDKIYIATCHSKKCDDVDGSGGLKNVVANELDVVKLFGEQFVQLGLCVTRRLHGFSILCDDGTAKQRHRKQAKYSAEFLIDR